jgi:Ca2+-binding RTX toxin-like protein
MLATALRGTASANRLTGDAFDNILDGGAGNDTLVGGAGNDILLGGKGNDRLEGGVGDDTYRFARGDGQDTIIENDSTAGNKDVIEFGADIAANDIIATRSGNNLILKINGTTDQITVSNHFAANQTGAVEEVHFTDGTIWSQQNLIELVGS